jgi:hypothetical protein
MRILRFLPRGCQSSASSPVISAVDGAKARMYFTDRNNKSVDVIDVSNIGGSENAAMP